MPRDIEKTDIDADFAQFPRYLLPRLFRERMDDFGLDFSVVYPTLALVTMREDDEELRTVSTVARIADPRKRFRPCLFSAV